MADTLLHITCANHLLLDGRLQKDTAVLLSRHPHELSLGAAIHDLPFYDNILVDGVRKLRGLPQEYSPFGQDIHRRHCVQLCTAALGAATNDQEFALAAGLISHFALDIVFHREIELRVRRQAIPHGIIENEIGLHCHYDLLGHPGVGSTYCQDTFSLAPMAGWALHYSNMITATYGASPTPSYFEKCLRGMRLFGYLHSTPRVPWVKTLADDNPELANCALALLDEAIDKAIRFVNAAYNTYVNQNSLEEFTATLPKVRMSDGLADL